MAQVTFVALLMILAGSLGFFILAFVSAALLIKLAIRVFLRILAGLFQKIIF